MKLVPGNDKILTTPCSLYEFTDQDDLEKTTAEMLKFMHEKNGVGLAAPQVGLSHRMFVIYKEPYLIINPDIIEYSDDKSKMREGCLSFPGLFLPIERANSIILTYQNIKGEFITDRFTGMMARIIQHETDHVNGIVFQNRTSKLSLVMADKKRKKLIKENRL